MTHKCPNFVMLRFFIKKRKKNHTFNTSKNTSIWVFSLPEKIKYALRDIFFKSFINLKIVLTKISISEMLWCIKTFASILKNSSKDFLEAVYTYMRKWEMCKSGYRPSNTLAYSAASKAACFISVQNCTDTAPKLT